MGGVCTAARVKNPSRSVATIAPAVVHERIRRLLLYDRPRRVAVNRSRKPDRSEATEYYFRYIDLVSDTDICRNLATQADETLAILRSISEGQSLDRYAPGKWSIRQVVGH